MLGLLLLALAADPAVSTPPPTGPAPTGPAPTIVVTGRKPPSKCAEGDQACLRVVAAEIWKQYPKETQAYCDRYEIGLMRQSMTLHNLPGIGGATGGPDIDVEMPPALKFVCTYKKPTG